MTLPVSKQMRYSQLFFHTLGSTSEFQLWEKNMIFPQLFRKLIFQRSPFFFFDTNMFRQWSSVLTFFWFHIIFCHICGFTAQMKFGEKQAVKEFSIKTRHWYSDLYKMIFFFQLLDGKNFQSKAVKALFCSKAWFRWNTLLEENKI